MDKLLQLASSLSTGTAPMALARSHTCLASSRRGNAPPSISSLSSTIAPCHLHRRQPRPTDHALAAQNGDIRSTVQEHSQPVLQRAGSVFATALLSAALLTASVQARPEGVNRPELLPAEPTPVIDVAGFLTPSEETKIRAEIESLERDTGFKLRLLAQNYPDTPGKAIEKFWGVDAYTVVFVADPTFGNVLNFNVGTAVDLEVPTSFWGRLGGKYGNKFYWQEKGEAASILNAVSAIDTCLREESGRLKCSQVQGELGEVPSSGPFGKFFGQ